MLTIIGTILASSLVAFSFARLRWPGRDVLFVVLLATMMLPAAVTMMPVFLIFRWLGWIDTLRPLWVPAFFGSAFNIFLLRQFFLTIPNDLEDAAKIDGCSYFGDLLADHAAAHQARARRDHDHLTFMGSWNNFMGPLIYISSPENMTLAYALQLFQGLARRRARHDDGRLDAGDAAGARALLLHAALLHPGRDFDGDKRIAMAWAPSRSREPRREAAYAATLDSRPYGWYVCAAAPEATWTTERLCTERLRAGTWAEVPDLPGLVTEGDTLDALVNALNEAVTGLARGGRQALRR